MIAWRKGLLLLALLALLAGCVPIPPPLPPKLRLESKKHGVYLPLIAKFYTVPSAKRAAKGGVGLTYRHCEDAEALQVAWEYDWSMQPPDCYGIENVPMVWGLWAIQGEVGGNSPWLMGFNEPDLSGQSAIEPATAAVAWREIERLYPDKKLVAPAPSHIHREWLTEFRDAYITAYGVPPRLDALAAHAYFGGVIEVIEMVRWYEDRAVEWNVPGGVWLTEFAFLPCYTSNAQARAAEVEILNWLEAEPGVARYAWFAARMSGDELWSFKPKSCLTHLNDFESGALTTEGRIYACKQKGGRWVEKEGK